MKWLTFKIQKEPGFRFNLIDTILLLFIFFVTGLGYHYRLPHYYYLLPLYVGGTFFLFCNIFRVGNNIEPVWYLTFVAILLYAHDKPDLFWWLVLLVCEPLKLALVIYRIWRGDYRGIGYRKLARQEPGPEEPPRG